MTQDNISEEEPCYCSVSDHITENTMCVTVNVQSLDKNLDKLQNLTCIENTRVLILTEIWQPKSHQNYNIKGFTLAQMVVRQNKRSGGVAIYVRDDTAFKNMSEIRFNDKIECATLEIHVHNLNIQISGIYRSPNHPLSDTEQILESILEPAKHKKLIIAGDLNIDLSCNNREATKLQSLIDNHNLTQLISLPTRIGKTSSTIIDHIITNCTQITKSYITELFIADHFACGCIIEAKNSREDECNQQKITANPENIIKLRQCIKKIDWIRVLSNDPETSLNNMQETLQKAVLETCRAKPLKNKKRQPIQPWMTKEILKIKAKITSGLKNVKAGKSFTKHRELKGLFQRECRKAKRQYVRSKLKSCDSKQTWQLINSLSGRGNTSSTKILCIEDETGQKIEDPKTIGNKLNKFFSEVGVKLANNLPKTQFDPIANVPEASTLFSNVIINEKTVMNAIKSMKAKTSTSHDLLSNKILKAVADLIITPLTHVIFNLFKAGIIPKTLKTAKVIYLKKTTSAQKLGEFRPISLLPVLLKLMDKIFSRQFDTYMTKNMLWTPHQHGYMRCKSTQTAVQTLDLQIRQALKENKHVCITLYDAQKAFDCLTPDILLKKLKKYGLRGQAFNFAKEYFTDRKQFSLVNNVESEVCEKPSGCPQGGTFSCFAYICYTNDLPLQIKNGSVIMYSDDTTTIHSAHNQEELEQKVQEDLERVQRWFDANKLSLNTKKTVYMIVSPSGSRITDFKLELRKTQLNRIMPGDTTKLLGFLLDDKLSYAKHITSIENKLRSANYALRRIKTMLDRNTKLNVYRALFESHLLYGTTIWSGEINKKQLKALNKQQKIAVRLINGSKYNSHSEPILKKLKILKIEDTIYSENITLMYKAHAQQLPKTLSTMLTNTKNTRHTRQTVKNQAPSHSGEPTRIHELKRLWREFNQNHNHKIKTAKALKTRISQSKLDLYMNGCVLKKCKTCSC